MTMHILLLWRAWNKHERLCFRPRARFKPAMRSGGHLLLADWMTIRFCATGIVWKFSISPQHVKPTGMWLANRRPTRHNHNLASHLKCYWMRIKGISKNRIAFVMSRPLQQEFAP